MLACLDLFALILLLTRFLMVVDISRHTDEKNKCLIERPVFSL